MSINAKQTRIGLFIGEKLNSIERSAIGSYAIDFTAEDISGNIFSLSDFLGKKIIVLDFWASWCAPCRMQNPFFQKIYNKYKESGLLLISISKDEKTSAWREAVKKENMNWLNTIVDGKNKKTFESYSIQTIPLLIVIDKNKKIIGRWTGNDEQSNVEIEKIIAENLR